jgi:hypothetical protein
MPYSTRRIYSSIIPNIWLQASGGVIEARCSRGVCKRIPLYGTGRPVEWINAFILVYLGRRSDTRYTIPLMEDRGILPDGTEVAA